MNDVKLHLRITRFVATYCKRCKNQTRSFSDVLKHNSAIEIKGNIITVKYPAIEQSFEVTESLLEGHVCRGFKEEAV